MNYFAAAGALGVAASLVFYGNFPLLPWTAMLLLAAINLARIRKQGTLSAPSYHQIFWFAFMVYLSTLRWHGGDDIPNSMLPYAILKHGTLSLEPFRERYLGGGLQDFIVPGTRPLLSVFSIIPGLIATPLYILPALANAPLDTQLAHNMSKITGAAITAGSVTVVYATVRARAAARWALSLTLAYAFGTWAFSVSSQALHSHGPAQLGVALGLFGLAADRTSRAPFWCGFGLALAVACREDSVFFLAAAGLYILLHRRDWIVRFSAGATIPLGINVAYWLYYTGIPKPPYMGVQGTMFAGFQWEAALAMLVSPTRGLIFFAPVAVFGIWAALRAFKDPQRPWAAYMAGACAALWMFISFRTTWSGGQTFGTRYFAAVMIVLLVCLADEGPQIAKNARLRRLWAAAFSLSVIVHALGAYFNYPGSFAIDGQLAELWQWRFYPPFDLYTDEGSLEAIPAVGRSLLATLILSLALPLARWNGNWLKGSDKTA